LPRHHREVRSGWQLQYRPESGRLPVQGATLTCSPVRPKRWVLPEISLPACED